MSTDVKDLVARLRVTWDVSEEAVCALNTLASEIAELKDEARTLFGEAANNRIRAEAAERERDALKAENEKLRVLVERAADIFRNCTVEDGMCCCGDDMERHPDPMTCGHSPTDHGGHIADQWMKDYAALHPMHGGERC